MIKQKSAGTLLYKYDTFLILQDAHNYIVQYSKTGQWFFSSLQEALYDIYLERIRFKLSEKQCFELLDVVKKIEECDEEMKNFIKTSIKSEAKV